MRPRARECPCIAAGSGLLTHYSALSHTQLHTDKHTHTHHMQPHSHPNNTVTHTYIRTHIYTGTCVPYTHTCTDTHTHTHTHTHTIPHMTHGLTNAHAYIHTHTLRRLHTQTVWPQSTARPGHTCTDSRAVCKDQRAQFLRTKRRIFPLHLFWTETNLYKKMIALSHS